MDKNSLDSKKFCNLAGVLASCTPKARKPIEHIRFPQLESEQGIDVHMLLQSIPPSFCQSTDWSTHSFISDFDETGDSSDIGPNSQVR